MIRAEGDREKPTTSHFQTLRVGEKEPSLRRGHGKSKGRMAAIHIGVSRKGGGASCGCQKHYSSCQKGPRPSRDELFHLTLEGSHQLQEAKLISGGGSFFPSLLWGGGKRSGGVDGKAVSPRRKGSSGWRNSPKGGRLRRGKTWLRNSKLKVDDHASFPMEGGRVYGGRERMGGRGGIKP